MDYDRANNKLNDVLKLFTEIILDSLLRKWTYEIYKISIHASLLSNVFIF